MSTPTQYTTCDECGMEYGYTCKRENYCPGCGHSWDYGNRCTCPECLTHELIAKLTTVAAGLGPEQTAAALMLLTPFQGT
jgi:hypothetical protein